MVNTVTKGQLSFLLHRFLLLLLFLLLLRPLLLQLLHFPLQRWIILTFKHESKACTLKKMLV